MKVYWTIFSLVVVAIGCAIGIAAYTSSTPSHCCEQTHTASSYSSISPAPTLKSQPSSSPITFHEYTADSLANSSYDANILFFTAPWCSLCQETEKNISSSEKTSQTIAVFSIDFDSSSELRKHYQVYTQNTFLLVDKQGRVIKRTTNLTTAKDIYQFVQP